MKKAFIISLSLTIMAIAGCKKPDTTATIVTEQQVLTDFAGKLANPNYQDIQSKANDLNTAVVAFNSNATDANLATAQSAWRTTRAAWESCEGYLFGPVEDDNYDPSMDTWPLDKTQLDSLLASSNALTVSDIDALPESLKGFHAIEYVIFGVGGTKTAAQVTPRQKLYLASLTQSLYNTTTALRNSWDPAQGNFTAQVTTAGSGSVRFTTKKAAFVAITTAMSGICDEVANGKMEEPLNASGGPDSTLDESSFSHNSTTDFTNNIKGVLNAYTCQYNGTTGASLHNLIAQKNTSLDNRITSKINAAVAAFGTINVNYEIAIYTQRTQIIAVQQAINDLKDILDDELTPFIQQNITD
ncbi:MAG: hypothetical protein JWO03_956 [Bacteroidetes bacterium]|nr:hypothetical protein [Bacteroidota bacterium]